MSRYAVGVDVGGTFTDFFVFNQSTGDFHVTKVPSTPGDPSDAVLTGLSEVGVEPTAVEELIHGTTVATNAIIESQGAPCGLITTQGFRDTLEVGRRTRPQIYGMSGTFEPIVPRNRRLEVPERIDAKGNVLVELDEDAAREVIQRLIELGAESLVIHFLHSYVNPAHELRCAEIARDIWPNDHITVGSTIMPEVREFERASTAAVNGYVAPVMAKYLMRLSNELPSERLRDSFLVMQGNGGMMSGKVAASMAVQTVMSGPAAGVIGAGEIAGQAGFPNVVTCDMGGTSFDVGLIHEGVPASTTEKTLRYGVPAAVPMVDVQTIGAAGGSICFINDGGLLQVGPRSAGAVPGPISYGKGGTRVTVTDANVVLGRIDPANVVATSASVGPDEARDAVAEQVGKPLGLDAVEAAAAILAVANAAMADAIRLVSVERGFDPREFALVAFGGAGPLHATALGRELGVDAILIPRFPGITSAVGCVLGNVRHDFVKTVNVEVEGPQTDLGGVDDVLRAQADEGRALLEAEGVQVERVSYVHEVDLLFGSQTHVFRLGVPAPPLDPDAVLTGFAEGYMERFGIEMPERRATLVNARTTVIGHREALDLERFGGVSANGHGAEVKVRDVYFDGGWRETPIVQRTAYGPGATIEGPAIVEQSDCTTVIEPDMRATVDPLGNLIMKIQ